MRTFAQLAGAADPAAHGIHDPDAGTQRPTEQERI